MGAGIIPGSVPRATSAPAVLHGGSFVPQGTLGWTGDSVCRHSRLHGQEGWNTSCSGVPDLAAWTRS